MFIPYEMSISGILSQQQEINLHIHYDLRYIRNIEIYAEYVYNLLIDFCLLSCLGFLGFSFFFSPFFIGFSVFDCWPPQVGAFQSLSLVARKERKIRSNVLSCSGCVPWMRIITPHGKKGGKSRRTKVHWFACISRQVTFLSF